MYDTRAMDPGELATEARERLLEHSGFLEELTLGNSDPLPPDWAINGGARGHGESAEWTDEPSLLTVNAWQVVDGVYVALAGPEIAVLLVNAARDFHSLVERLEGNCWGYGPESRTADGLRTGHALGKAICLNANLHAPSRTLFTPMQAELCRAIAAKYDLIWGGDGTQSPRRVAEAHFEFGGNIEAARVKVEELREAYVTH